MMLRYLPRATGSIAVAAGCAGSPDRWLHEIANKPRNPDTATARIAALRVHFMG
jgi:hypothetical protein